MTRSADMGSGTTTLLDVLRSHSAVDCDTFDDAGQLCHLLLDVTQFDMILM